MVEACRRLSKVACKLYPSDPENISLMLFLSFCTRNASTLIKINVFGLINRSIECCKDSKNVRYVFIFLCQEKYEFVRLFKIPARDNSNRL